MKNALACCSALLLAFGVFAEESSSDTDLFRLSVGGYGQFGGNVNMSGSNFDEDGELYGTALDLQFNVLPLDNFNLWISLGGTYAPEQSFCDANMGASYPGGISYTQQEKIRMESYGLRVMLIPEWKPVDYLGLGLRLGAQVVHYSAEDKYNVQITSTTVQEAYSGNDKYSETQVEGIVGLQLAWSITDYIGLTLYGDAHFGSDVDFKYAGLEIGEFEPAEFEVGLGVTFTF